MSSRSIGTLKTHCYCDVSTPSIPRRQVPEVPLYVSGVLDASCRLMTRSSDWSVALRAACRLHGHATFAYREWMPVFAPVPMPSTTELPLHGSDYHPHLTLVPSFV